MVNSINSALLAGYNALNILSYMTRKNPKLNPMVSEAKSMGYSPERILSTLVRNTKSSGSKDSEDEGELTEHEKVQRRRKEDVKKNTMRMLSAAALAGSTALGVAASSRMAAGSKAIRPEVLPPLAKTMKPKQLSGNIPRQIGYGPQGGQPAPESPMPQSPMPEAPMPEAPQPSQSPITTPYQHTPETNIALIKNIGIDKPISQAIQSGLGTAAITQFLQENLPKRKLALLEKAPGGIQQAIEDYMPVVQQEQQTNQRNKSLQQFEKFLPEDSRSPEKQMGLMESLKNQFQEFKGEGQEQIPDQQPVIFQDQTEEVIKPEKNIPSFAQQLISDRSPSVASMDKTRFSLPNYMHPSETKEDFSKRKRLTDVLNEAGKLLASGKSFLDIPIPKGPRYSTASDVLKFMAGIPSEFDYAFNESEKDEIFDSLEQQEEFPREGGMYGANMTPNLIWNMLLALEPKIKDLVPPSIKGKKDVKKGGKMGTTEARRFLTHAVYGILSGKTISHKLSDKIQKISKATKDTDVLVKAAKAGNWKKVQKELEILSTDDEYFQSLLNSVDDALLGFND